MAPSAETASTDAAADAPTPAGPRSSASSSAAWCAPRSWPPSRWPTRRSSPRRRSSSRCCSSASSCSTSCASTSSSVPTSRPPRARRWRWPASSVRSGRWPPRPPWPSSAPPAATPAIKWTFDWGSLVLAGVAAAVVFEALPARRAGLAVLAALAAALVYYLVNAAHAVADHGAARGRAAALGHLARAAGLAVAVHYIGFGLTAGAFVVIERDHGAFADHVLRDPARSCCSSPSSSTSTAPATASPRCATHRDELGRRQHPPGQGAVDQPGPHALDAALLPVDDHLAGADDRGQGPLHRRPHRARRATSPCCSADEIGLCEEDVRAVEVGVDHPRHRQDRHPGRHPRQARQADRRGVRHDAPASGDRQLHRLRARPPADRPAHGPQPPRALGRPRLPRRPRGRGDPARRPHPVRRRHARRDDLRPLLPEGAADRGRRRGGPQSWPACSSARRSPTTFLRCFERDPSLGGAFSPDSAAQVA